MVFRATVIALLGSLLVLHIGSEVRFAHHSALTASMAQQPSAAPAVVVQRDARPVRLPADTMVVDVRATELDYLISAAADGSSARLVPTIGESGKQVGWKIYAIADGTLMSTLGFENGDTLLALNDQPARELTDSAALFAAIHARGFADFKIRRRGQLQRIVVLAHM